jgi:hypothetical protein
VFIVACTCSDSDCSATSELIVADLREAEHAVCTECECTLVLLGVSEHEAVLAAATFQLAAAA